MTINVLWPLCIMYWIIYTYTNTLVSTVFMSHTQFLTKSTRFSLFMPRPKYDEVLRLVSFSASCFSL